MHKKCYFCKGKVSEKKVAVDFRWGQNLVVIEDVPAGVCRQCGEKYFNANVYKGMEKLAKTREEPIRQITVDVVHFRKAI